MDVAVFFRCPCSKQDRYVLRLRLDLEEDITNRVAQPGPQ